MNKLMMTIPSWVWIVVAIIAVALVLFIVLFLLLTKKKNGEDEEVEVVEEEAAEPEKKAPAKSETEKKSGTTTISSTKTSSAKPAEEEKTSNRGRVYHITERKDDGKWQIKGEGDVKAIKLFDTQAEAIAYGKTLAENQDGRIVIHKKDGTIRKLKY